ncbi:antitoxin HicB [Gammaproteobacteria bacterium]
MKFIIAIEPSTDTTSFGVVVPDLPGCFSAGETLEEAIDNACEAISLHCETIIEDGESIPLARSLSEHQSDPEFSKWIWAVVEVPVERYFGPAEKIHITLLRFLLTKIGGYIRDHDMVRSSFLAEAARGAIKS